MNYYKFHIGDYARDTSHLSILEDGAYSRMLALYYKDEQPLPADRQRLYRLIRATSEQEQAAVDTVLAEFFTLGPDGWNQSRADRELSAMREKAELNRLNGRLGGRPGRQEQTSGHEITMMVPRNNPDGSQKKPKRFPEHNHVATLATSHKPLAISHYPLSTTQETEESSAERSAIAAAPPVITLPCIGGVEFPITESQRDEWGTLFPAVDVPQALRGMRAWLLANEANRKTQKGVLRFVTRWLSKEQDKPRGNGNAAHQKPGKPSLAERATEARKEFERRFDIDGTAERVD